MMKVELLNDGAMLRLVAESGPELDVVVTLLGVHALDGPLAAAQGIRVPTSELGFAIDKHGVHYFCGDGATSTLVGLEVPIAWLRCRRPAEPEVQLRKNVALRLGYGLLDALDLLQAQRPQ
jgi:hypothetical protein